MRKELLTLIKETIVYEYDLPSHKLGIQKSVFSTLNDKCYSAKNIEDLANIIYNSLLEYSFNENEITGKDFDKLHARALIQKLNYKKTDTHRAKISYGFHGETLLYCILCSIHNAKPIIARGTFYNPLEFSETKGYDSYHLVQNKECTELWFGEVKFRQTHYSCINSALENIDKAISDDYLNTNMLAICNRRNDFNIKDSIIDEIIRSWEDNPSISILEEIKKYNIKLVYPMIMVYDQTRNGYDESIKKSIKYIEKNYNNKQFSLSINYSIYFIWMPIEGVKKVKETVIEWIESKKQLI